VRQTSNGQVTITAQSPPGFNNYGTPLTWVAPASGNVLVTWHKVPPYLISCLQANLGFRFLVNGLEGSIGNLKFITAIHRYGVGDIPYPPIVDRFTVTAGVTYSIQMQYFLQNAENCIINAMGNSSGGDTFVIEYIN
jgi:hypothetical protein